MLGSNNADGIFSFQRLKIDPKSIRFGTRLRWHLTGPHFFDKPRKTWKNILLQTPERLKHSKLNKLAELSPFSVIGAKEYEQLL